ncbi:MAG TPA: Uma2 family endonuclease, partial [Pirellulales bacterium]
TVNPQRNALAVALVRLRLLERHLVALRTVMVDPAPDLAVEVEISRGAVQRMPIYAALGVLEVWRWHHGELSTWVLEDERYVEREFSLNLPMLRVKDLEPFLEFERAADETAWIRDFRAWVRANFHQDV